MPLFIEGYARPKTNFFPLLTLLCIGMAKAHQVSFRSEITSGQYMGGEMNSGRSHQFAPLASGFRRGTQRRAENRQKNGVGTF